MEIHGPANIDPGKSVEKPELQAGALSLIDVLMQAVTHIAPGAGLLLSIQFIVSQSGMAAPLAFLIAFVIVITLGISLTQLAKHLPSAGGYYTYLSRTVNPQAGFLTSWLYFLYDPIGAAINIAFFSFLFESTLKQASGFDLPWWITFLLMTAFVTFMLFRGIKLAGRILVVLGSLEILILVVLAFTGLLVPGHGGFSFKPFLPSGASTTTGLALGVVFSIFSFTGFESVAPLAEESKNPRRNLPRAIIGSLLIMGVFYVFTSWGTIVGWGVNDMQSLSSVAQNPVFVLGQRLWGGFWWLLMLALFNSIIAVSIACNNAATRVFFGMARTGVLPKSLAVVHPKYKTPTGANILQAIITIVVGLGLGFLIGPDQEYFLMGVVVTLGLGLVYCAGNIGVYRFYRTERRREFNWLLHMAFPLFSTLAILVVIYLSVVPLPAYPVNLAPFIVVVWLVVGIGLMIWLGRTGNTDWVTKAREPHFEMDTELIESEAGQS